MKTPELNMCRVLRFSPLAAAGILFLGVLFRISAEIPSGMILLEAEQAVIVTGSASPPKLSLHDADGFPVLGYWIAAEDSALWRAPVPVSGNYRLLVESGDAPGNGTNLVRFSSGNAGLEWSPKATLAWDDIQIFILEGSLRLEAGQQTFRLDVLQRRSGAVMNLRSIALLPENVWKPPAPGCRSGARSGCSHGKKSRKPQSGAQPGEIRKRLP